MSNSVKHLTQKVGNFTVICNDLINDDRLALDERMLLIWALSKPNDWQLNTKGLKTTHSLSNDKLSRITKSLQQLGYLKIEKYADGSACWFWYEKPDSENQNLNEKPDSDNRNSENRNSENRSALVNKDLIQKKDKELNNICADAETYFEDVWWCYPTKVNKKKAKTLFVNYIKKHKLEPKQFAAKLITDIKRRQSIEQFGFDRLHFTTYMNGERWNDDYKHGNDRQSSVLDAANAFVSGDF